MIVVRVYGEPAPQGSKQAFALRAGNKCPKCKRARLLWRHGSFCSTCQSGTPVINMTEMATGFTAWRNAVKAAATAVMLGGAVRIVGPVQAAVTFTLTRPKYHYTPKGALSAEGHRNPYPDGPPDLSKLIRATEDALTDAKVWADDSRVVDYTRLAKVYPLHAMFGGTQDVDGFPPSVISGIPDADALTRPGAVIRLRAMIAQQSALDLRVAEDSSSLSG